MYIVFRILGMFIFIMVLVACSNSDDLDEDTYVESYADDGYLEDEPEAYHDPYPEFCLLGDKPDVDPAILEDDDCIFDTEGRNRADGTDPKANAFFADVSDFVGLEKAGIKRFGVNVKVGAGEPKIEVGSYTVIPYEILSTEKKQLPDMMIHLSSIENNSVFNAVMKPDADKFRGKGSPENQPSYEVVSASLVVSHVEDIPMDEDEKERHEQLKRSGLFTGQQYVKGTLTFEIKKLGANGADFGPQTFTFGSRNDWSYFPEHSR